MTEKKIQWLRDGKELRAIMPVAPRGFESFLREEDLIPIQKWCEDNNCGRRMSFDTFRFKKREDITMFLLRWS